MAPPAGGDHDFAMPSSKPDHGPEPGSSRLTNADFRKLMMTPRSTSGSGSSGSTNPAVAALGAGAAAAAATSSSVKKRVSSGDGSSASGSTPSSSDKAEKRKKKKNYYAKLKKQEDDKMAELAIKYRDRAKERRDGYPDQQQRGADDDEGDEGGGGGGESKEAAGREGGGGGGGSKSGPKGPAPHAAGGYRAVAPDLKSSHDAAERRKRMIQESKFLGGDMEHTHLVKGLDFALLQKVRSEIVNREKAAEEEEKLMKEIEKKEADPKAKHKVEKEKEEAPENQVECRTALAKGIIKTAFKTDLADRNELFFPGRMAYVMELEDETGGGHDKTEEDGHNPLSDIPTTTIRSKADVAGNLAHQQAVSMSANDIVINKLTSIFSYLRAARGKKKKKDRTAPQLPLPHNAAGSSNRKEDDHVRDKAKDKAADLPIFDDVGDYEPDHDKRSSRDDRRRGGDRDRGRDRRDDRDRRDRDRRDRDRDRRGGGDRDRRDKQASSYFDRKDENEAEQKGFSNQDKNLIKNLMKREEEKVRKEEESAKNKQMMSGSTENDFYAEAYPGIEMNDAIDDSDEEADYTKMDLGNKKGPVGRWDFDTAEEYSDYMSKKEALPKAAFQYGVKMTEGRKTRGKVAGGPRNEKAKLDKEWNKISSIIDKRKTGGGGGGGSASKKPKYD